MLLTIGVLLLCKLLLIITNYNAAASLCFGGHDMFTSVRENSPVGTLLGNLSMDGDPDTYEIFLEITGDDADWFYLEGKSVRLNASLDQNLDREVHGSVLKASVGCYENETLQSEYEIVAEILNENDNAPAFLEKSIQAQSLSELTAVNSVVFALQASDADGDTIIYEIDESSPDAEYFKIELPNSGQVLLNKPLDYETKTELHLRVFAVEMNTKDHLNATASLVVQVLDGDDHYPLFRPCAVLPLTNGEYVCANPVYTTNITERDQDTVLDFYPGPVHAVDGDAGLNTPLVYSILSGADNGRFLINCTTGEITLTRPVENRLLTPSLRLRIMAAQVDDLKKYSVATAIVRVVAENRFPPQFQRLEYRAFVTETTSPASFVLTYGNELLILQANDQDFPNGMNPKVQYSLETETELFSITKEGFLIARGNQPPPPYTHHLTVVATDSESGDVSKASVSVMILHRGQPVPHSPLAEDPHYGQGSPGRAVGVLGLCLMLLGAAVCMLVRWYRRRKRRQDPADRASVAQGKHPNVVNHGRPVPLLDEVSLHNEALGGFDASVSPLHGKAGIYTVTEKVTTTPTATTTTTTTPTTAPVPGHASSIRSNGKASDKPISKSVSFHDMVIIRAGEAHEEVRDGGGVNAHTERAVNALPDKSTNKHSDRGAADIPLVSTSTGSMKEDKNKTANNAVPPVPKLDVTIGSEPEDKNKTANNAVPPVPMLDATIASEPEDKNKIVNTAPSLAKLDATIGSESDLASQSTDQGDTKETQSKTILSQEQPNQSSQDKSNLEQSTPGSTTHSDTQKLDEPDKPKPDDSTPVESKTDQENKDESKTATATAETEYSKEQLTQNQSEAVTESQNQSLLQLSQVQVSAEPKSQDSKSKEHTLQKEESKPHEVMTHEPQPSVSHTNDISVPTALSDIATVGPVDSAEDLHKDRKDSMEEMHINIPEPSTDAVKLAGPSTHTPEAHHTPSTSTSAHTPSTHTQDEPLTQADKLSSGPSSEEKSIAVDSGGEVDTGETTNTRQRQTESVADGAIAADAANSQDSEFTVATEATEEESEEANIKAPAADTSNQERKTVDMPDIIITGTTDVEDDIDDMEEKFTKVTNLDDDVTDVNNTGDQ